jgi:hypothetical protein
MKIVEVLWEDITSNTGWHEPKEILHYKPLEIKTVGYLINKDKKYLKLGHTVSEDNDSDFTIIPVGVIKKIRSLK